MSSPGGERRRNTRLKWDIPIQIADSVQGKLLNVSSDGFCFTSPSELQLGKAYPFRLRLPTGVSVVGQAVVRWRRRPDATENQWRYGVAAIFQGSLSHEHLIASLQGLQPFDDSTALFSKKNVTATALLLAALFAVAAVFKLAYAAHPALMMWGLFFLPGIALLFFLKKIL